MSAQGKKNQSKPYLNDNLIEQLRDVGRGVTQTVKDDLISGVAGDALSSLFGAPGKSKSGDLTANEEVNFNEPPPMWPERRPMNFPRREQFHSQYSQEVINRLKQQENEVVKKIEEIRVELKALVATLKSVDSEIEQAVGEQLVNPGLYHLNYLDRIKRILKLIRQNLSDSRSWLSVMRSRKKERTYWRLYKKKGTEFGLNSERVVATQVG